MIDPLIKALTTFARLPDNGEFPTYGTMHSKVNYHRGKASAHLCACGCGRQAEEWSYDRADPNEVEMVYHGSRMVYSLDISHYRPMARICHRRFDAADRRERRA